MSDIAVTHEEHGYKGTIKCKVTGGDIELDRPYYISNMDGWDEYGHYTSDGWGAWLQAVINEGGALGSPYTCDGYHGDWMVISLKDKPVSAEEAVEDYCGFATWYVEYTDESGNTRRDDIEPITSDLSMIQPGEGRDHEVTGEAEVDGWVED